MPPCPSRLSNAVATLKSIRPHPTLCSPGRQESTRSLHVPLPQSHLTLMYGCVLRRSTPERSPLLPRKLAMCENLSRSEVELLAYACGSASPFCPTTLRYTRQRWIENLNLNVNT